MVEVLSKRGMITTNQTSQ